LGLPVYLVYSLVLGLVAFGYLPVFLVRKVWRAGHPLALRERLGFIGAAPGPEPFWIHAVSVGEVMAAVPLVRALRARWPEVEIVLSTVTATGNRVARARLPDVTLAFAFPLDLAGAPGRAVRRLRPRCFIALETEIWPNLLRALARSGVPAVLANGRISDRSYGRYRRVRWLFRRVLDHVALFAMQSEEDARRIVSLGARPERVVVTGNLKMEAAPGEDGAEARWRRALDLGEARVWVAGSTHRGEEGPVLDAFLALREVARGLQLVLAPRHPERVEEVEGLVRGRGLDVARRSRLVPGRARDVLLLDSVGELGGIYGVADVVFVGGSLVPRGGHNVIEPALHAKPVVFGPHMGNFREAAALLLRAEGGTQVQDGAELASVLRALFTDATAREARGAAARRAVQGHQGACARTIAALDTFLERRAGNPSV